MPFEGEFASYEPLRRLLDSDKVRSLQSRFEIRTNSTNREDIYSRFVSAPTTDLTETIKYLIAIDGSTAAVLTFGQISLTQYTSISFS